MNNTTNSEPDTGTAFNFNPEALGLSAATKKLQSRLKIVLSPILILGGIFLIVFVYEYSTMASITLSATVPISSITAPHSISFSRLPNYHLRYVLALDENATPVALPVTFSQGLDAKFTPIPGSISYPFEDSNRPQLPKTIIPTVKVFILPTTITLTQTHLTLSHPTDPSSPPTPIATLPVHSYLGIRPIAYLEDQTPDGRYAIIRINYRLYLVDTIQRAAALVVENGWAAKFVEQGE